MEFKRLTSSQDPLYRQAMDLYAASFPLPAFTASGRPPWRRDAPVKQEISPWNSNA